MNHIFSKKLVAAAIVCSVSHGSVLAQNDSVATLDDQTLKEVQVVKRRSSTIKLRSVDNATLITSNELLKAACCNLGESFTTNPSVDVNYSDAATGAKQIKLFNVSVAVLVDNKRDRFDAFAEFNVTARSFESYRFYCVCSSFRPCSYLKHFVFAVEFFV